MSHIQKVRRQQGLCAYCGRPQEPGYKGICAEHLVYQRERSRKYYRENGGREKARATYEAKRAILQGLREGLVCVRCGESHPACLDFHHRDATQKSFTVAKFAGQSSRISLEDLRAEVAKCDVLCANCHRIHHWEEHNGRTGDHSEEELR
jgi:hypothetical protein